LQESSVKNINVSGAFIGNVAQANSELLDIAKRLRDIAVEMSDKRLQEQLATQINRVLDLAEQNDRAVRAAVAA
jgi:hypothetical protein